MIELYDCEVYVSYSTGDSASKCNQQCRSQCRQNSNKVAIDLNALFLKILFSLSFFLLVTKGDYYNTS